MLIPLDYRDLLKLLNKHKAQYLIVGAYAAIYYTEPRYTKDLDIWINPSIENIRRVWDALKEFGAPLKSLRPEDFNNKNLVYQIGIAPIRVDIIMGLPKLEFSEAWKQKSAASFEGVKVNIIGIKDLIKAKKKAKRQVDLFDVNNLRCKLNSKSRSKQG